MRVREIMGKVIKISFFVILIMNWGPITTAVEDTFVKVGQIASAHQTATKPSSIMVEAQRRCIDFGIMQYMIFQWLIML